MDLVMKQMVEPLLELLEEQGMTREKAEAVVHALVDIEESLGKVYGCLLPELMRVGRGSSEAFKDKLWDIREEFRHVAYHLEDAELTDL